MSSLYLICPSDSLEHLIETEFKGDVYFYTALGVYFEFDINSQLSLWKIIHENDIDQITFVTSIANSFYKDALQDRIKYPCPLTESLQRTHIKIYNDSHAGLFHYNFHLLVYQHLKKQINRLINTEYLGKQIKNNKLCLNAYIYQPYNDEFCNITDMEWKGQLFNHISYN